MPKSTAAVVVAPRASDRITTGIETCCGFRDTDGGGGGAGSGQALSGGPGEGATA
jgi:hypothetical protein